MQLRPITVKDATSWCVTVHRHLRRELAGEDFRSLLAQVVGAPKPAQVGQKDAPLLAAAEKMLRELDSYCQGDTHYIEVSRPAVAAFRRAIKKARGAVVPAQDGGV